MKPITLAVEDIVAESLVGRIIAQSGLQLRIDSILQKKGITYLRGRADSLNRAAHGGVRSILLADADSDDCPAHIARAWFPNGRHPNLAFRVSVRASEAWVLADAVGLSAFAGVSLSRVPADPDALADPKRALVDVVRTGRRDVRELIVPRRGASVPVGVGYNQAVTRFVQQDWDLQRASVRSASLRSFVDRIELLAA